MDTIFLHNEVTVIDSWTDIVLPNPEMGMFDASERHGRIEAWATTNKLDQASVRADLRTIWFKNKADATFFQLSFTG